MNQAFAKTGYKHEELLIHAYTRGYELRVEILDQPDSFWRIEESGPSPFEWSCEEEGVHIASRGSFDLSFTDDSDEQAPFTIFLHGNRTPRVNVATGSHSLRIFDMINEEIARIYAERIDRAVLKFNQVMGFTRNITDVENVGDFFN